jgi:EAL domain-containing protein (putative c-di-GMP-specific phosphodiesterase class I)
VAESLIRGYLDRLPASRKGGSSLHRLAADRAAGAFYGAELVSVFQPVYTDRRELAGHAGYIRSHAHGAAELSPWQVFALAANDDDLVRLDRLCRTLHALNYFDHAHADWRLHLPVELRLLAAVPSEHGRTFEGVLGAFGIATSRVVIELPRAACESPALLGDVIANYRRRKYAVSVRAGREGLETLRHFRPDIVRLGADEFAGDRLRDAVGAVHALGAAALVERIETAVARVGAESAGADFLQGYYLGRPAPDVVPEESPATRSGRLSWLDDSAALIGSGPLL